MDQEYKSLCQVFTPKKNANEMLDWCMYKNNISKKKIIENSCGNGHILMEIVRRYIENSIMQNISLISIKKELENNIYGTEYDTEKYKECIANLNSLCYQYKINNINWKHIKNKDALINYETNKFDFVIGNPPYIKYSSLSLKDRNYIKDHFETCKNGKFDYCYAFIEMSINSLKNNGIMAYLVPSSIFKNVFANDLRIFMKKHIIKIYDYTTTKLFNKETNDKKINRLTSSAVIIVQKNSNKDTFEYIDINKNETITISKKGLEEKWIFKNSLSETKKNRFGDYFNVSNTIATLYNKAYVINDYFEDENYIYINNNYKVEKKILKDTISPKTFNKEYREKIIFPYKYNQNGTLIRYKQNEFEKEFPYTVEYLKTYDKELKARKSDISAKWFEYGRSQALNNSNQPKILISTIITNKVNTKMLTKDIIPYSGLYITKKSNKSLKIAEKILTSQDFYKYVCERGIIASGNSYRITAKDIMEYHF